MHYVWKIIYKILFPALRKYQLHSSIVHNNEINYIMKPSEKYEILLCTFR